MDSPHLLHLGLLLLALAALCPSIAMSSAGSAKGTQRTPSGNTTTVTVYHCKDCESSTCKSRPGNFENFEKIAVTQDRIFSNGIIELVTRETNITVCFEQRNYFPEGICGIFWEKDGGVGYSCGILNSGENGIGNISTEDKICCEAEANIWKRSPTLKCYTQKSHPKPTTPPADIPDEGIPGKPEFLTYKKSSTGILLAFLFVGFLAGMGTMYYCLRLRRGKGGGNEQSTDVVSAWEGGSVSITCPMNGSQNQVRMYLTAIRENLNVMYFSRKERPNINPDFANRISYSEERETLRITLHRLQQSDSKIYLCSETIKVNDRHKNQYGKTTIVVVKAKSRGALEQSPLYANPEPGQSVSITCVLRSSREDEKFHLLRTHVQPGTVLSVSNLNVSRVSPAFENRLEYSREGNRSVITLHNLQGKDSDNYVCAEEVKGSPLLSASGTMVLVQEVDQACEKSSWGFYGLLIVVALLFCALVCCTLYRVDVKKYFQKKKPNAVYEDMSYNSRRSTLVRTNTYSRGE